jgi:hypothetical protein
MMEPYSMASGEEPRLLMHYLNIVLGLSKRKDMIIKGMFCSAVADVT